MKMINNLYLILIFLIFLLSMLINLIPSYSKFIHPMLIGMILLILSIINSLNLNLFFNSNWFSMLMFLIIVGGMLILFLYFTSFIMNMKISLSWNFLKNIPLKIFMFIFFIIMLMKFNMFNMNYFLTFNEINKNIKLIMNNMIWNHNLLMLMFLYNYPLNLITLLLMLYLFFCLTTIVKICLFKKKSIRKLNYYKINF